jgi:DNA-binding MarR family transcriptional regulator
MKNKQLRDQPAASDRQRRRLNAAIRASLRDLASEFSLLNHNVGARLDVRDGDLGCLDLIDRRGPLSPSELAREAGLHPATITGVLDRLERSGWIARDRDPADRRAVIIRPLRARNAELLRLYSGMNTAVDQICAGYADAELELVLGFFSRLTEAGRRANGDLAGPGGNPAGRTEG